MRRSGPASGAPWEDAEREKTLKTVLAKFDDYSQIAFEVERLSDGRAIVFLPGAPDAWSGSTVVVDADRITPLDLKSLEVVRLAKNLGKGSRRRPRRRPRVAASD